MKTTFVRGQEFVMLVKINEEPVKRSGELCDTYCKNKARYTYICSLEGLDSRRTFNIERNCLIPSFVYSKLKDTLDMTFEIRIRITFAIKYTMRILRISICIRNYIESPRLISQLYVLEDQVTRNLSGI